VALAGIAGRGSTAELVASLTWMLGLALFLIGIGWPERRLTRATSLAVAAVLAGFALTTRPPDAADIAPAARLAAAAVLILGALLYASAIRAISSPGPASAPPDRFVRTKPYAIVRHPAYLGAALVLASSGVVFGTLALGLASAAWVLPVIARTVAEDRLLHETPDYRRYAAAVRWRLFPRVW
jgi:protein-S-isoprenylcysteine O-methyltransferase Ste14